MANLLTLYNGAVEDAEKYEIEITKEYFEGYAFGALDIALLDDALDVMMDWHKADQNSLEALQKIKYFEI